MWNFTGEQMKQQKILKFWLKSVEKVKILNSVDARGDPLDCPAEWEQLTHGSHYCYRAFMEEVTWADAESICQGQIPSGHLLSIHHETKNFNAKAIFNGLNGEVRVIH